MESWMRISLLLSLFGFLKQLRPIEPFVTEYIIQYKNVTAEEVIHIAFPISTYSSLASLAIILLITDLLRYKPIVVLEGICHVLTWGILTLSTGLTSIIVVEFFYGIGISAELAYSTYIYAQVDKSHYKKVTSHTKSASLAGKFFGGLVAQLLITFNCMNYHQLNYITLACISVGLGSALFLPNVKSNHQFYLKWKPGNKESKLDHCETTARLKSEEEAVGAGQFNDGLSQWNLKQSIRELIQDLKTAYGNPYVLKWSLWWAIASAGQYQVINYVQALWDKVRSEGGNEEPLYNGAVKALHTLLSAILSFCIGYTSISWEKWGEVTLLVISVMQGLMLVWMAKTDSLLMAYASYVIFRTIHPVMITVASVEVAQQIRKDSYGLIFGINMFIALCLQTLLTLIVSDLRGLALDERSQYLVYGFCFISLGGLIGATSFSTLMRKLCREKSVDGKAYTINTCENENDL